MGKRSDMWEYTPFLEVGSPPRPIYLEVEYGRDCIYHRAGSVVLPDGWWEVTWAYASELDPGFCLYYGKLESMADELCLGS